MDTETAWNVRRVVLSVLFLLVVAAAPVSGAVRPGRGHTVHPAGRVPAAVARTGRADWASLMLLRWNWRIAAVLVIAARTDRGSADRSARAVRPQAATARDPGADDHGGERAGWRSRRRSGGEADPGAAAGPGLVARGPGRRPQGHRGAPPGRELLRLHPAGQRRGRERHQRAGLDESRQRQVRRRAAGQQQGQLRATQLDETRCGRARCPDERADAADHDPVRARHRHRREPRQAPADRVPRLPAAPVRGDHLEAGPRGGEGLVSPRTGRRSWPATSTRRPTTPTSARPWARAARAWGLRSAPGLEGTWPSDRPAVFRTQIDHVVVTDGIHRASSRPTRSTARDHRAALATVAVPK